MVHILTISIYLGSTIYIWYIGMGYYLYLHGMRGSALKDVFQWLSQQKNRFDQILGPYIDHIDIGLTISM